MEVLQPMTELSRPKLVNVNNSQKPKVLSFFVWLVTEKSVTLPNNPKKLTDMRKVLLFLSLFAALAVSAQYDEGVPRKRGVVVPGKGHVDTELLNKKIDLQQDVSQLNLTEVRVLRNAFFARAGYPFKDSFLRGMFSSTSWYDSLMMEFDGDTENFRELTDAEQEKYNWREAYYVSIKDSAVKLTPQEQAFIKKLQAREKELLTQNFVATGGNKVNKDNIYNSMQLTDADPQLTDRLLKQGFAIVPASHEQLFHVYEANDYACLPSFVTTDLYLQLFHLYFDCTLRDMEEQKFDSLVGQLCQRCYSAVVLRGKNETDKRLQDAAEWLKTYFAIAMNLQKPGSVAASGKYADDVAIEVQNVNASENNLSDYLGYTKVKYAYSLYRPRGHYTRTEKLQRYFRMMMWLQTVNFGTDNDSQLLYALTLADIVGGNKSIASLYRNITEPITYLMGQPDNVDIMQVYDVMHATGLTLQQLVGNKAKLAEVKKKVEAIAEKQTRIKPKYLRSSVYKVNLMPQRYQPDAEVLQEMVDYDNNPTKRGVPQGLDIFAAMGVSAAERILLQEQHEATRWSGYLPMMERMKTRMSEVDWQETMAKRWMKTLQTVSHKNQRMPYFMLSPQWDKKNLNAMLASWAELKHDAILYAKQPMGAECGGGGPPDPVTKAYVEPNVTFWKKAIELVNATTDLLDRYGLTTEKSTTAATSLCEEAEMLLKLSEKELEGKTLTDEEYDQLSKIGSSFEYISLDLVRQPSQDLYGWSDVQGPDRKVALVADVYTANADNNPEPSILYEAVGLADEIYVVVEIGGILYLTRGAVLSYREFRRPTDMQRLTDEEWQQNLENHPREGVPEWMEEIIVPLKEAPKPNDEYFYSSGC